jgi:O-antigen biosynthesis alpha-1,2-mannosyltransferase
MRILIDMQGAQTLSRFRGIGRYSLSLAQAIVRQAKEHDVWLCLNGNYPESIAQIHSAFNDLLPEHHLKIFHTPKRISWDLPENFWRIKASEMIRESFLKGLQPDIVYITSLFEGTREDACLSVGALNGNLKTAITLYDLIPLLNSEGYLGDKWVRQWYMKKISQLEKANLLLAISNHARQEAIDNLNVDSDCIINISSAISDFFHPRLIDNNTVQDLYNRYGIRRPFIMFSGTIEARKNIERLLEAFSLLKADLRASYDLVISGKNSEIENQRIMNLGKKLSINDHLVLTGYTSDDDLVALYNLCELFVLPSLHEGFGLPALEAMSCGAPTIGSNTTSIPEVIGRSDAIFDPYNSSAIAEKISEVLINDDFRQRLREHGLNQAKKFSWDQSAKLAIYAFERIYKSNLSNARKSWRILYEESKNDYYKLIDAIANLPINPVRPSDEDIRNCSISIAKNQYITSQILRAEKLPNKIVWRIEGPFDSSYSLALLNRETARAMITLGHHVVLHSTEGPGDFEPNKEFLRNNPDLARLYSCSPSISALDADVTSRNLFPPRVSDMQCRLNLLHHFAWEESGFFSEWVDDFNNNLQGITCLSNHVKKILVDHGVTVPLSVSGCGIDHWEKIIPDENFHIDGRSFRFLHVSSCFPRKGVAFLIQAYFQAFTIEDDVTLVIKTFPNPHNEVHRLLTDARKNRSDSPDVLIIEDELSDSQLKALYKQCHSMVAPSLAEGFGLPLAEAMLSGLAVITTGWGGQSDFCDDQTAWLIDYEFTRAKTHFELFDSVWATPDVNHLSNTMREVYELPVRQRSIRSKEGRKLLLDKFCWVDVADRLVKSARYWARIPKINRPCVGWVTTWNSCCGIATYSAHLLNNISADVTILAAHTEVMTQKDEASVVRCWYSGGNDDLTELADEIRRQRINTIIIQFNYGFFNFEHFDKFLSKQLDEGRIVIIIMHSTNDPTHVSPPKKLVKLRKRLRRCHRILVHTPGDINRLKAIGLIENVTLFPHGILEADEIEGTSRCSCFTIGSYGFFLPHKGLLELIEAISILKSRGLEIQLRMVNAEYPIPQSARLIKEAKQLIKKMNVEHDVIIFTEFLPDNESFKLLLDVDLIVYPYQETGESASGAARFGLATGKPVAVTPINIFEDLKGAVHYLPGRLAENIADGIASLKEDMEKGEAYIRQIEINSRRWCADHRYSKLGPRLYNMIKAMHVSQ